MMEGETNIIEEYNISKDKYTIIGKLKHSRYNHSSIILPDGNILTAGGVSEKVNLDMEVFNKNLDPKIKRHSNNYKHWKNYVQSIEIYDTKSNTSKEIGKLQYAIGDNLKLFLLNQRFVLILNGKGKREEIIDLKTHKTYPTPRIPFKEYDRGAYVQLNDNQVFIVGSNDSKSAQIFTLKK